MNNSSEQNKNDKDTFNEDDFSLGFGNTFIEYLKENIDPDLAKSIEKLFNEDNEDIYKDAYTEFYLYNIIFKEGSIKLNLEICCFGRLLDSILSKSFVQKVWKDIKKRFGKETDEQELYRIFKFLIFMFLLNSFLELAKQKMSLSYLINNNIEWLYHRCGSSLFGKNRKLDENKFKEIVKKMYESFNGEFYEKFKQHMEKKGKELL